MFLKVAAKGVPPLARDIARVELILGPRGLKQGGPRLVAKAAMPALSDHLI